MTRKNGDEAPRGVRFSKPRAEMVESYLREGAVLRISTLVLRDSIIKAADAIADSFRHGGKLMTFGNGGSAADAQHIAAEFSGRFRQERDPLPALALTTNSSAVTSIANDYTFEEVFARQVRGLAKPEDTVLGISTSGASRNVLGGLAAAQRAGARTIGLCGTGGKMGLHSDILLEVPSKTPPLLQETHIAIAHILCFLVEEELFG